MVASSKKRAIARQNIQQFGGDLFYGLGGEASRIHGRTLGGNHYSQAILKGHGDIKAERKGKKNSCSVLINGCVTSRSLND